MDGISWTNVMMRVASIPSYDSGDSGKEDEIDLENIHKYLN